MENKKLNMIEDAEFLAQEIGLLEGAEVDIDLSLHELICGGCRCTVYIGTSGGLRKTSMSAEKLSKFLNWFKNPTKIGTYCIIHGNDETFVEVIKHEAITGIRFALDKTEDFVIAE